MTAGHRPDHERGEFGDVVGEVVGQEPSDVEEGLAALPHGRHDRGEVVVEQDQVRSLPGDLGAGGAHRDADVGHLQRRCVVHAITGHRHDVPTPAQGLGDPQLVLGRGPGQDHAVAVDHGTEHLRILGQVGSHQHR